MILVTRMEKKKKQEQNKDRKKTKECVVIRLMRLLIPLLLINIATVISLIFLLHLKLSQETACGDNKWVGEGKQNKLNGRKRSSDYMVLRAFVMTTAGRISRLPPVLAEFCPDWEACVEMPCAVCGPSVVGGSCWFHPYLYLLTC